MIDLKKLRELVQLMADNELAELDLRDGDEQVSIKRYGAAPPPPPAHHAPPPAQAGAEPSRKPGEPVSAQTEAVDDGEDGLIAIESPMVGTFYTSANPDSPPFVSVGASVGPDTVVCLVEAMKVFNEVKAEVAGTVEKVLVKSGEAVEFGQKLFLIKPA